MMLKGCRMTGWVTLVRAVTLFTSISEAASTNSNIPSLQPVTVVRTKNVFAPNSDIVNVPRRKALKWHWIRGGGSSSSSDSADPLMTIQEKSSVRKKRKGKK